MFGSKWRRSAILWLAQRAKPSIKHLRTFVLSAEKGRSEPRVVDAAAWINGNDAAKAAVGGPRVSVLEWH